MIKSIIVEALFFSALFYAINQLILRFWPIWMPETSMPALWGATMLGLLCSILVGLLFLWQSKMSNAQSWPNVVQDLLIRGLIVLSTFFWAGVSSWCVRELPGLETRTLAVRTFMLAVVPVVFIFFVGNIPEFLRGHNEKN